MGLCIVLSNLAAFWKGRDQGSWDRLIKLVEGNVNEAVNGENRGMNL